MIMQEQGFFTQWILVFFFVCFASAVALLVGEKMQEETTLVVSCEYFCYLTADKYLWESIYFVQ